jgi:predicted Zn-dependent peptidase
LPPVGAFTDVTFPKAEHARLNNGIEIVYLRNAGAPLTELQIEFDAGTVADPVAARGTHAMLIDLLSAGTTSRDAATITRLGEQMGAGITFEADTDRTTASLSVPTANLQPGLFLIADMLRNTAFAPAALATARAAMHAAQAESGQGDGLFEQAAQQRTNPNSPYARRAGPRDAGVLDALTGDDFRAVRDAWLRPEKATVFVVSNAPFADVRAMLERSLGDWRGTGPAGVKDAATAPPPAVPGIVLIDRPGTDQAIIAGVQALPAPSPDTLLAARVADTALAGDGMGRIIDDLRESKGWTYSVNSMFAVRPLGAEYRISAPVQHDKAGAAIASMRDHLADFTGTKPMTHTEFTVAIDNRIRAMAVELSGATAFMGAIRSNRRLGLPDDADAKLASRYRALTLERARAAFRATVDPAKMVWIVAGDAAVVKPQLASLGLPISVVAQGAPAVP